MRMGLGWGGGGRGNTETKTVCQTVKRGKIQNSNYLHNVKHFFWGGGEGKREGRREEGDSNRGGGRRGIPTGK